MQPEFEDEEAIDPFDFWQGANFKLKAKNVAGYRNYDSSEFARQDALLEDDEAMEAIWKKEYSLEDFVAPDQFKSYDELKKRLDYVLGIKGTTKFQDQESVQEEEEFRQQNRGESNPVPQSMKEELDSLSSTKTDDEDDDTLILCRTRSRLSKMGRETSPFLMDFGTLVFSVLIRLSIQIF